MNLKIIREVIENHWGINIPDQSEAIFRDPKSIKIISQSWDSFKRTAHAVSLGGDCENIRPPFEERFPQTDKRITGAAYDSQGRRIPHVSLYQAEADRINALNPGIVARATRRGVEIVGEFIEPKKDYTKNESAKSIF